MFGFSLVSEWPAEVASQVKSMDTSVKYHLINLLIQLFYSNGKSTVLF